MLTRDTVVTTQMSLGLAPEVLNAIDMVALGNESDMMLDPFVAELGDIQCFIGGIAICVND